MPAFFLCFFSFPTQNFAKYLEKIAEKTIFLEFHYSQEGLSNIGDGVLAAEIRFSRKPYTIKYYDLHGDLQSIKRRPPAKLHDILPTDKVELNRKKNDDWDKGDLYTAKHINPRHPNVIQIKDDDGNATFVSSRDLDLKEKVGRRNGIDPRDEPINNEYLNWP